MNPQVIAEICSELTLLRFFPSEQGARTGLFLLIGRMCSNEDQVRWLVQRTLNTCNEWPGPLVLRQILCSKFRAADGIDVSCTSMFPDGVPSSKPPEAWQPAALPPGCVVSADRQLDESIKSLAVAKDLNRPRLRLPVAPAPRVLKDPLTPERRAEIQAQIDREIEQRRVV